MSKIITLPNKSGVDLSTKDGYAVKFDTDGINVCGAATDRVVGVITTGAAAGGNSGVCVQGSSKAIAGGTIVAGQHVTPTTDGRIIATGATSQDFAIAQEGGVAGDWISIVILGVAKTNS